MGELYLGVEIGGSKLQICVGDGAGQIVERLRFAVDASQGAEGILRQLRKTIPDLARAAKPAGAGVGFGGPVDRKTGHISCSHQIEGWSQFALGPWLSALIGAPVLVDNDANVAALGEARRGAGSGLDPVFYVTLGSGVGGGLVANGSIYHGAAPGEAEIGHVRLDRSGAIVESRCSGWAVDRKVRTATAEHPESTLAKTVGDATSGEAKFLKAALAQQDPLARRILDETAQDLAFGLSHVVHLFHPQVIVIGGGLSLLGEVLREAVEESLRPWIMEAFAPGPGIVLARLGEDAVPVGAVELAAGALGAGRG